MIRDLHLSMLAGPVVPVPMPREVVEAVQQVQITNDTGARSGFQITFALSARSPLHTIFLLSGGAAPPLFRVILTAVINGFPQVLMDGLVTHTEVSGGGGTPGVQTLTVSGQDLSAAMDLVELTGLPYPGISEEARINIMLAKYAFLGVVPVVIPRLFPETVAPTERIPLQHGTDYEYINQMASWSGYVFYVDPGPAPGSSIAYWGPEIKVGVPQPVLSLDMDAHRNVDSLSVSFTNDRSALMIAYIQNETTHTTIPIPVPPENPLSPPMGLVKPLPKRVTQMTETAALSPGVALGRVLAQQLRTQDAISASGSLDVVRYGRLLKARGLVGVRGAGPVNDGLYFVKSVTTTLKRGECKQSFSLTRNALVPFTPVLPVTSPFDP